ncbi:MAG: hypothetical protein ACXW32_01505, partial [Limisphaerales bacterium]
MGSKISLDNTARKQFVKFFTSWIIGRFRPLGHSSILLGKRPTTRALGLRKRSFPKLAISSQEKSWPGT